MTESERELLTEIRRLQRQVAVLHARGMRHGWLRHVIKDLEVNPRTQYQVHLAGCVYWLVNFPLVIGLFFGLPAVWVKVGVFITLMYSVYANLATDYGAMSAALAAQHETALPEIPLEP